MDSGLGVLCPCNVPRQSQSDPCPRRAGRRGCNAPHSLSRTPAPEGRVPGVTRPVAPPRSSSTVSRSTAGRPGTLHPGGNSTRFGVQVPYTAPVSLVRCRQDGLSYSPVGDECRLGERTHTVFLFVSIPPLGAHRRGMGVSQTTVVPSTGQTHLGVVFAPTQTGPLATQFSKSTSDRPGYASTSVTRDTDSQGPRVVPGLEWDTRPQGCAWNFSSSPVSPVHGWTDSVRKSTMNG